MRFVQRYLPQRLCVLALNGMYVVCSYTVKSVRTISPPDALRLINQRLRKLEKSDSEKTEEIGRLNRIINRKDKEIHSLKAELATTKKELSEAKARIMELEGDDGEDGSSGGSGKPEKNSSNSSVPPSQESIAAREQLRRPQLPHQVRRQYPCLGDIS